MSRRLCIALVVVLAGLALARVTDAEELAVPAKLQAELLGKVAGYDKNLASRAGDKVHVLVVVKPGDESSVSTGAHIERELRALPDIGGLPHDEATTGFAGADALAKTITQSRISIVYLTPGMRDDLEPIARALATVKVLSVGAFGDYVPRGAVLGFDLVSGKPKLAVNLPQAKKQGVEFRAEVLKLMKVYE